MSNELELIRGLRHIKPQHAGCALAIGNFDGVHLGHQALIRSLQEGAALRKLPVMVVVFEPQTGEFFLKDQVPARLMRLREKVKALQELGVQRILVLPFNFALANLSAEHFIQSVLLEKLQVRYLVAGDDFRFGQNRRGTLELLQEYGIETATSRTFYIEGLRVSSTAIRRALGEGRLDFAEQCLGHPFSLSGCVKYGDQRGRSIGVPTANLSLHRKKVPLSGVYVVRVKGISKDSFTGVANVGTRPTVCGTRTLLEVHIFDFNQPLYGRYIDVEFIHKLREEQRYDSFDALKAQIFKDVEAARWFLRSF